MHQNGLEIFKNMSKQKNIQKIFYTRAVSDHKMSSFGAAHMSVFLTHAPLLSKN